jgi:multisubunit Na+/H+ antiporter MnhC subunit
MNGSKKLIWQAFDHIRERKSSDWFWFVGIMAVAVAVLAIFFNNVLLAILVLIGTFVIFLAANNPPKIIGYEINRRGVQVGDILYTYATIESFCVIDEDGWDRDRLILKSKKTFMPLIVIPLGSEVQPDQIRDYLLEYLNEEELFEPTLQRILSRLGF